MLIENGGWVHVEAVQLRRVGQGEHAAEGGGRARSGGGAHAWRCHGLWLGRRDAGGGGRVAVERVDELNWCWAVAAILASWSGRTAVAGRRGWSCSPSLAAAARLLVHCCWQSAAKPRHPVVDPTLLITGSLIWWWGTLSHLCLKTWKMIDLMLCVFMRLLFWFRDHHWSPFAGGLSLVPGLRVFLLCPTHHLSPISARPTNKGTESTFFRNRSSNPPSFFQISLASATSIKQGRLCLSELDCNVVRPIINHNYGGFSVLEPPYSLIWL